MFDKLIESNTAEAEFKPRRKFFMVSSVVVGILFLSAVVASLYAKDIDLGTDNFELAELLAPVAPDAPEPEPPRQQPQQRDDQRPQTELPNRPELIAQIDQVQEAPTTISTVQNRVPPIPIGPFTTDPNAPASDGVATATKGNPGGSSSAGDETATPTETVKATEPPPAAAKPRMAVTGGVVNGKATYLPAPAFPAPAKLVGAYGVVNVQVTIDEDGKVIASKAISGHALLRQTAESAAWKARFSPTLLSKVPVKVTGVIVYNFKKS